MVLVYGTCVAIGRTSVLLRGPSGSGKSDLALRLIDCGARLVADDQVSVTSAAGWAIAESPPALRGLLEVRGIGILSVPWCASAAIGAVIDLASPAEIERLPEPDWRPLAGILLPHFRVAPFEASAPAKVRLVAATAVAESAPRRAGAAG